MNSIDFMNETPTLQNQYAQQAAELTAQYFQQPHQPTTGGQKVGKRTQVSRACANCRKVHTGCDANRPCRRCILYNLECIDLPRKKRSKSPKPKSPTKSNSSSSPASISSQSPLPTPQQVSTQDVFDPLYDLDILSVGDLDFIQPDTVALAEITPTLNNATSFNPSNGNLYNSSAPQNLSVVPSYQHPYNHSASNWSVIPQPSQQLFETQQMMEPLNKMTEAITILTQQMTELRTSNKSLERKLSKVTEELDEVKSKSSISLLENQSQWFSFRETFDLSISVWKPFCAGSKKELILVECNNNFKQLVGYPDEVLRNNFTASRLLNWQMHVCPRFRETVTKAAETGELDPYNDGKDSPLTKEACKPMTISFQTQINVLSGMKNVSITINPIVQPNSTDVCDVKYFIMHTLELR
jgi:hypothetical protein